MVAEAKLQTSVSFMQQSTRRKLKSTPESKVQFYKKEFNHESILYSQNLSYSMCLLFGMPKDNHNEVRSIMYSV